MYDTTNPIYAAGEYFVGFLIAALSVFTIAIGLLFGFRDAAHYIRISMI